jgi:hypothetical protein
MGVRKFASFLFFTFLISTAALLAVIVTAATIGYDFIPSPGPFFLIFALLLFFYCK